MQPKENPSKKRRWFYWAGISSIAFSVIDIALLIAFGKTQSLIFSQWYQFFVPIPAFIAGQLSGWTTVGRENDLLENESKKNSPEQWMTLLGITMGLIAGISLVVTRWSLKLATAGISDVVIELMSATASILGSMGSFAGLASRIESIIVKPKAFCVKNAKEFWEFLTSFFNQKRKSVIAGLLMGIGTSFALWFTGSATLTLVVGVTSFFTGGAAIPLWITGGLFCLGYIGTNASSFDYISKMYCFFRAIFLNDKEAEKDIGDRFHEYRATALGVTIGLGIAAIVGITLLVTQPYLIALVGGLAAFLACTSTFGSLFSHLGTLVDIKHCRHFPHEILPKESTLMTSAKISSFLEISPPYHSCEAPPPELSSQPFLNEYINNIPAPTHTALSAILKTGQ